jgi:hypothetical protein
VRRIKIPGVHFGTSPPTRTTYSGWVKANYTGATAAALCVLALGAVGLFGDVSLPPNWMVLAACAIVPPLIMMRYGDHADQTTSHSSQRVLR